MSDRDSLVRGLVEYFHAHVPAEKIHRSFLIARGKLIDRSCPTRGLDVFFEELIGARQIGWHRVALSRRDASGRTLADARNGEGRSRSAMAAVAGDFAMAVEVVLIDRTHHSHHLPCGLLGFLVVLVEMIF